MSDITDVPNRELLAAAMTLRDWFAGQVLAGDCMSRERLRAEDADGFPNHEDVARWAYEQANAMLQAREVNLHGD